MSFKPGPAPMQEPIDEKPKPGAETKRPRGRPRNDGKPAGSVEAAPSRPRNLQQEVAGLLMSLNFGILLIGAMPGFSSLQRDRLDEAEILVLSNSIVAEAKRNARFARMVDAALFTAGGAGLLGVIGIIVARRAARHQILPQEADAELGAMFNLVYGVNSPPVVFTPPVEQDAGEQAA